jgi:hypothetical protein
LMEPKMEKGVVVVVVVVVVVITMAVITTTMMRRRIGCYWVVIGAVVVQ